MHERHLIPYVPKFLLVPGARDKFLFALGKGASYVICCGFAGFSRTQLNAWIKKGEAIYEMTQDEIDAHPDKVYYDFVKDIEEAEAKAALRWLDKVEKAAAVQWQAAAWKLAKRYPKDYGNTDFKVTVEAEDLTLSKAKEEAARIQEEKHGRSTQAES